MDADLADLAVWWLSQDACEQLMDLIADPERNDDDEYDREAEWPEALAGVPPYARGEVLSRHGRAGRGRLWVPDGIACRSIGWDSAAPLATICGRCGGVVVWRRDAAGLAYLPGFVTDAWLRFLADKPALPGLAAPGGEG